MPASHQRLYVNIDHVATLRQARGGSDPDPVAAAALCVSAGADGVTAHLREDRRHIKDADVERLRAAVRVLNLEIACTDEMLDVALRVRPDQVTFVPERREEVTTERGLDLTAGSTRLERGIIRLKRADIRVSLFVNAEQRAVETARSIGAHAVELHTGEYAHDPTNAEAANSLRDVARAAADLSLAVHAGHGLTAANLAIVAAIPEIEELNIGHSIVSRAIFIGLVAAVRDVHDAMLRARSE